MKRIAIALSLLLGATAAGAQSVEVASGDWSNLPEVRQRGQAQLGSAAVDRIEALARDQVCNVRGLNRRRLDLDVPFAIQFQADGSVQRVVLCDLGCPQLERILATAVLQLAQAGRYRPTGENRSGWYRGAIGFESS